MQTVFFPYLEKEKKIKIYNFHGDENFALPCFNRKMEAEDKDIIESTNQEIERIIKNDLHIEKNTVVLNLKRLNDIKKRTLENRVVNTENHKKSILIGCKALSWNSWACFDHKKMFLNVALILKKIIPEVKIIFIIRHQISYLVSQYKSSIHQRYMQDMNSFILNSEEIEKIKKKDFRNSSDPQQKNNRNMSWIYPIGYDYAYMIENYYKLFGKKNCLVLFSENLKDPEKKEEQYTKLTKFFDVEESEATKTAKNFIKYITRTGLFKLNSNVSYTDEVLYFTFIFEKFLKYFGIKIPYAYAKNPIKSNFIFMKLINKIIKIVFFPKYISWLKIREILQNQNHIITKIIKILFKNKKNFLNDELIKTKKKFSDLDNYFDELNYKLLDLLEESEIPKNFLKK
jgi:hypothetical protein